MSSEARQFELVIPEGKPVRVEFQGTPALRDDVTWEGVRYHVVRVEWFPGFTLASASTPRLILQRY